jgi:hypothetical protein
VRSKINERSEDFTSEEEISSTRGRHDLIFRNRQLAASELSRKRQSIDNPV